MTERGACMTEVACALNIPAGQWHTLMALESGTVILEMKDGVYESIGAAEVLEVPLALLVGYVEEPDINEMPVPECPEEVFGEVGEIRPGDVPVGDSIEDRRARNRLIRQFYYQWMAQNVDRKIFNKSLDDYIHVKYISINETAGHASLRYLSTLAVLQLDAILPNAILKTSKPINPKTKNQKGFSRMLIMEYCCPAIGLVRLTVGQKGSDGTKVQYCITAIEVS